MSKSIEDMLNLPPMSSFDEPAETVSVPAPAPETSPVKAFEDDHAESMDKIFKETLGHASDLMDYGYNAEPRSQSTIWEKANMLYNTALNAKKSKRDAQHKEYELELKRRRLVLDEKKFDNSLLDGGDGTPIPPTSKEGWFDRNDLVRQAIEDNKKPN